MSPVSFDAPVRVPTETKEKVQLTAAILGMTQGEFVALAMKEYLEAHRPEIHDAVARAREVLKLN